MDKRNFAYSDENQNSDSNLAKKQNDESQASLSELSSLFASVDFGRSNTTSTRSDLLAKTELSLDNRTARYSRALQAGLVYAAEVELREVLRLCDAHVEQQKEVMGKNWADFHQGSLVWLRLNNEQREQVLTIVRNETKESAPSQGAHTKPSRSPNIDDITRQCMVAIEPEATRMQLALICNRLGKKSEALTLLNDACDLNPLVKESELAKLVRSVATSVTDNKYSRQHERSGPLPNLIIEERAKTQLTARSLEQISHTVFNKIDTDKDGEISQVEVDKALQNRSYKKDQALFVAATRLLFNELATADSPSSTTICAADFRRFADLYTRQPISEREIMAFANVIEKYDRLFTEHGTASLAKLNATIANHKERNIDDGLKDDLAIVIQQSRRISPEVASFSMVEFGKNDLKRALKSLQKDYRSLLQNDAQLELIQNEHANRKTGLFSDRRRPLESIKPEAVQQGNTGDCYFLAAVAAMAAGRPAALARAIKDNHDGTYTVTFPGAKNEPITVDAPTEAEMLTFAAGNSYGNWVATLEKAYGAYCAKSFTRRHLADFFGTAHPTDATDGGSLEAGVRMMSSKSETLRDPNQEVLAQKLAETKQIGAPVIVALSSLANRKTQWSVPQHAYSVTNYDAKTGTVTLRNPWGGRTRGTESDTSKTMSLQEFAHEFSIFCFGK